MNLVVEVLAAGVLGTVAMDLGNLLFSRAGILSKIDMGMIGRMAAGWTRGRLCYQHPSEMEEVRNEKAYGYLTHYAIGVGFTIPYILGWALFLGGPRHPYWPSSTESQPPQPPGSSSTPPWGSEPWVGGLPMASGRFFHPWPTTSSSAWEWRAGSPSHECRGR